MQQPTALNPGALSRPQAIAGLLLLLSGTAAAFFTGQYLLAIAPFAILWLLFMGADLKAAWFVFLFTIPVSVQLSFAGDSLSTSLPDEPLMGLFLLALVLVIAAQPRRLPAWWWRHPLTLIVLLQLIWTIVAVLYSTEVVRSVKFLLAKCWFLGALFVFPVLVFEKIADFRKAFFLVLIPMLVTMAVIFVRHAGMGFEFLEINKAVGILYYNRVDYSSVMAMFFPFLIVAWPRIRKSIFPGRGRVFLMRATLAVVILFFLVCIYLTFARGAMLAVVVALGTGFLIRKRLVQWMMPAVYGIVTMAVVFLVQNNKYMDFRPDYEHTYTHLTFADHMIATFRGQDMSSMERLYRWIAGARMSLDKPITGYGPNNFYENYKPYAVSSFRTYVSRNTEQSTTHNYFLYMLVEQGWPALILYAVLLAVAFVNAQRTYHRFAKDERFWRAITLGVAMCLAAGFVVNFFSELIETHKVGALFFISLAMLIVLDKKSRDLAHPKQEPAS